MWRRGLLLGTGSLLLAALLIQWIVVQYYTDDKLAGQSANRQMHRLLESPVAGWEMVDLPLGTTELLGNSVKAELNLDDYFYRSYKREDKRFEIFVCYWGPNKMPANLVASHTPDRCWSQSGWTCEKYDLWLDLPAGTSRLQPGFWRTFQSANGDQQEVVYWHLIGGRAQIYAGNSFNQVVSWRFWWKEAFIFGVTGNAEQYFVRITSNCSLKTIWNEPGVQTMLARVAALGVKQTSSCGAASLASPISRSVTHSASKRWVIERPVGHLLPSRPSEPRM